MLLVYFLREVCACFPLSFHLYSYIQMMPRGFLLKVIWAVFFIESFQLYWRAAFSKTQTAKHWSTVGYFLKYVIFITHVIHIFIVDNILKERSKLISDKCIIMNIDIRIPYSCPTPPKETSPELNTLYLYSELMRRHHHYFSWNITAGVLSTNLSLGALVYSVQVVDVAALKWIRRSQNVR